MIKIIIEAKHVPDGTKVTKATGTQKLTLLKEGIKLYTEEGKEVHFDDRILLQSGKTYNAIKEDTLVAVWCKDAYEARDFIEEHIQTIRSHK